MDIRTLPEPEQQRYNRLRDKYSLHFSSHQFGDNRLRLLRVGDIGELLDGDDPFADVGKFPFWAVLWDSSLVLAETLARTAPCRGGRLLDLDAGLGLAGLAAATAGFETVLTSGQETALDFQRVSAAASGITRVQHCRVDLANPEITGSFEIIAGAELLSRAETVEPVLALCKRSLEEGGTIFLAHDPKRKYLPVFLEAAEPDFAIGAKLQRVQRQGEEREVLVNRLRRR